MQVIQGDLRTVLTTFDECSIDCVVTDPPYGLKFMGKNWDHSVPGPEYWEAILRVCKPGAMMLAFGGTRTHHRLMCSIEDAGWEIRDCLMWLYGSGFPKSHDIGKVINNDWQGWGTALKPAWEPIILAMKPLDGTYAQNAERHDVAGINIDACRIDCESRPLRAVAPLRDDVEYCGNSLAGRKDQSLQSSKAIGETSLGRFPANLILDEETARQLDEQSGDRPAGKANGNALIGEESNGNVPLRRGNLIPRNDTGGASRFFYCAKASKRERNKNCENVVTWENVDLNQEMDELLYHLKDIFDSGILPQEESGWNIILSGNNITDQSRRDIVSIISILIKLIIELKTYTFSLSSNTNESILGAIKTLRASGLNLVEVAEKINQLQNTIKDLVGSLLHVSNVVLNDLVKINAKGKNGNVHPCVKPLSLMKYLLTLLSYPKDSVILDPFAGSGTTLVAAKELGRHCIGIELDPHNCDIIRQRLND